MKCALICPSVLALVLSAIPLVLSEGPAALEAARMADGMVPGSAARVESALKALHGVGAVKVDGEAGPVAVAHDPAPVSQEEFTRAMQAARYLATFA